MGFREIIRRSKVTDWLLVAFTGIFAVLAIFQFIIIQSQLDVLRKQERAWIIIEFPKGPSALVVGKPLSGSATITNMGRSPAFDIAAEFYIEIVPNGSAPHFEQFSAISGEMTAGTLLPNHSNAMPIFSPNRVTKADNDELKSGNAFIATHGVVRYRDVFKVDHWIKVCEWGAVAPGAYSAKTCTAYEATDDR